MPISRPSPDGAPKPIDGSQALAWGALAAGVQFVTGYPGSPSTDSLEALLRLAPPSVRVEWAVNEKSAFDAAFGASLGGLRSLLCVKSVGLNVALDSLMVANLAGSKGGLVIVSGDDPGGWGSQNEEDSRPLAVAAEVPLLEPTDAGQAVPVMAEAFQVSQRFEVPVVVRITRALAAEPVDGTLPPGLPPPRPAVGPAFRREADRYNVLPIHVVDYHRRLIETLGRVRERFESSPLNAVTGQGRLGVLAAGQVRHKLEEVLARSGRPPLSVLRLATLFPLPERRIVDWLRQMDRVLILEELAPLVEIQVQAMAQRAGLSLTVAGRSQGLLPVAGELAAPDIASALASFADLLPEGWALPKTAVDPAERGMPSRRPLCDDCPYIPALQALLAVMDRHGGRDAFLVTGETGCMVRAQLPPWEILDVKYGMGASIGLGAGLARAGLPQRVVALSGDSALLHSGLAELIDASQAGVRLLVVVLANETTALSGGQPHPATAYDLEGHARRPVDLEALIRAAGVDSVATVDPVDGPAMQAALEAGLASDGMAVVISRRACPRWP